MLILSPASVFDLTAAKEILLNAKLTHNGYLLADKAYCDSDWSEILAQEHGLKVITPLKRRRGDTLYSAAVEHPWPGALYSGVAGN